MLIVYMLSACVRVVCYLQMMTHRNEKRGAKESTSGCFDVHAGHIVAKVAKVE